MTWHLLVLLLKLTRVCGTVVNKCSTDLVILVKAAQSEASLPQQAGYHLHTRVDRRVYSMYHALFHEADQQCFTLFIRVHKFRLSC